MNLTSTQRPTSWPYNVTSTPDSTSNSSLRNSLLQNNVSNADLNALVQRSQFAFANHQQLPNAQDQQSSRQSFSTAQNSQSQLHAHSFDGPAATVRAAETAPTSTTRKNSPGQVRRRTSRACDQCNQLRTKCDGKSPCGHCVDTRLTCEYARTRKKRGKASKKDLAEQAAATGPDATLPSKSKSTTQTTRREVQRAPADNGHSQQLEFNGDFEETQRTSVPGHATSMPDATAINIVPEVSPNDSPRTSSLGNGSEVGGSGAAKHHMVQSSMLSSTDGPFAAVDIDSFMPGTSANSASRHRLDSMHSSNGRMNVMDLSHVYDVNIAGLQDQGIGLDAFTFPMDSPSALLNDGMPGAHSPGALSISGAPSIGSAASQPLPGCSLRYPVLIPLLPHIKQIMPQSLATELLEHYFASSSSAHPHPASPYLLGFVFSKRSFLRSSKPRDCSPALLASMLWIAARTSDARAVTSPPSARGRLCQKLLNLSISLLRPLIHGSVAGKAVSEYPGKLIINGSALGGAGVTVDHLTPEKIAAGTLDDVATYMHIAIVVSASEDKAASLRWWTAAWALAKELKLGRELLPNAQSQSAGVHHQEEVLPDGDDNMDMDSISVYVTEEEREERRRLWWVLYIVDRHLALCYNRPLTLLEVECAGLLRPMDERAWQSGNFPTSDMPYSPSNQRSASRFEFTGPSIFGYFLPLMTILGEIVDLHQAHQHPLMRFMPGESQLWDSQVQHIIASQLESYERSMQSYQAQHLPAQPNFSDNTDIAGRPTQMTESQIHLKIAIAYSTHVMHVLHILSTGKWDPIALLDDNDLWISSPSFVTAIGHAVSGAEAVTDILGYDPEINFMPFLYGIYLLQGSFLLLLIADKLQGDASPNVVRACETIVRAHEACVVTLDTGYQRAFRKVMQSALAQVRGRVPEDKGESQRKRWEILALYRWTGDGTGLAI